MTGNFWSRNICNCKQVSLSSKKRTVMAQRVSRAIAGMLILSAGLYAQIKTDAVPVGGENLSIKLKALLEKNHYPLGSIGILLKRIENDSTVAAVNADEPFNPASVSKLATAAMAFDRLGTGYTFKTRVYTGGPYNPDSGVCNGDLYIKGGGDPLMVIERMWVFVERLYRFNGLRCITGDIVLDDSFFDTAAIGPCFIEDSIAGNPYAAPIGALCANFNIVELCIRPSCDLDAPVKVEVFPRLPKIDIVVKAKTVAQPKTSGIVVESEKSNDRTRIVVAGAMGKDAAPYYVMRKVRQTGEYFGGIVKLFFDEKKITIKGKIRRGLIPDSMKAAKPLYTWESPPLWEIVADMMKFSTNLSAEMLFKTFSAVRDSGGGSWEKSSEMMQAWWKEKGLPGSPVIKNGSGMGDCNRFTVSQLAALLNFSWNQKTFFPEYLNAFSIAGNDGTLRSRFKGSRLKGRVRGKTGTLNEFGVYSMAGYVLMPKADYIFVIVFNNIGSKFPYHHWEMQQKILEMLVPE